MHVYTYTIYMINIKKLKMKFSSLLPWKKISVCIWGSRNKDLKFIVFTESLKDKNCYRWLGSMSSTSYYPCISASFAL